MVVLEILDDFSAVFLVGNKPVPFVVPGGLLVHRGDHVVILDLVFVPHDLLLAVREVVETPGYPEDKLVHLGKLGKGYLAQCDVDGTSHWGNLDDSFFRVLVEVSEDSFVSVGYFVGVPILVLVGYSPVHHLVLVLVLLHSPDHPVHMVLN